MIKQIMNKIFNKGFDTLVIKYEYGYDGRIINTIRNDGRIDLYIDGLLTSVILPNGASILYEYDEENRIIKETHTCVGEDLTINYTYDFLQNTRASYEEPTGRKTVTKFNGKGRVVYYCDSSYVREYRYSKGELSNIKETMLTNGKVVTTTFYKENTCGNTLLKAITSDGEEYHIYKAYDLKGRLIKEVDSRGLTIKYKYNFKGKLAKQTIINKLIEEVEEIEWETELT